jgi:hypothetical protein
LYDYRVAYLALSDGVGELYGAKTPKHMKALIEAIERLIVKERARAKPQPMTSSPTPLDSAAITVRALAKELGLSSRSLVPERLHEAVALELVEIVDLDRPYGRTEPKRYRVVVPSQHVGAAAKQNVFPTPKAVRKTFEAMTKVAAGGATP